MTQHSPNVNPKDTEQFIQSITRIKETDSAFAVEILKKASEIVLPEQETVLTTHCFKILPSKLELIRNIVYTKKQAGFTSYSQTQAIHEAVDLLSQTMVVKERGKKERDKEQAKSIVISRAMKKKYREKVKAEAENIASHTNSETPSQE